MTKVSEVIENEELILNYIHNYRGLLWERIAEFNKQLLTVDGAMCSTDAEMQEMLPVKHHLKDGLYTREILMPKGMLVVSFIHKQSHPSFFLSGEMSILNDAGKIERIKAPMKVMTEIGTQRVAYMHEDCVWVCVYNTDKNTIEEVEADVYTLNHLDLPEYVILNRRLIETQNNT
jgi:hypothetical protein